MICRKFSPLTALFSYDFSRILNHPSPLHFSNVSSISDCPFIVNYLVSHFGFSSQNALNKSKGLEHIKTPERPDRAIAVFKEWGFAHDQIKALVKCKPKLLSANVEKTLGPKMKVLQDLLGLSNDDIVNVVARNPDILSADLEKKLKPLIKCLQSILDNNHDLALFIGRARWCLCTHFEHRLLENLNFMRNRGIPNLQMSRFLVTEPGLFVVKESKLREIFERVDEIGVPSDSGMFIYAALVMGRHSRQSMEIKFETFRSLGFSEEEIATAFRKVPKVFTVSEKKLHYLLNFFTNVIGADLSFLVRNPKYFMYSVEARLLPRYRVLKLLEARSLHTQGKLYCSAFGTTNKVFLDRFVYKFKDHADDLYEAYLGNVQASVKVAATC